ncbi:hypothetical protein ACFT7S_12260 [Streptomyces sp. NPDC057136]|uniref:hypothetical protein n=1 Tax=Streptomyces sp. NPDC057136 TaxID=3346029 RepID=UPI003632C6B3
MVADLAAARLDKVAEQALAHEDPWDGFAYYIETLCELQAAAPDAWRRGVAFMLDGLRTEAAHSLPTGPRTSQQVYEVMAGLTGTP